MRCPKGEELGAYIDGELGAVRTRRIMTHIATCPHCTRTAESLRAVRSLLLSQPRPQAGEWFTERAACRAAGLTAIRQLKLQLRQKTVAWGIAAVLIIFVGSVCLIVRPWSRPDDQLLARCVERFEQGIGQKDGGIRIEQCTSPWDAVLGEDIP